MDHEPPAAATALERQRDTNAILAEVLRLGLDDLPLEQFLDAVLARLLDIPWLTIEARGGIFLVADDAPELVLVAKRDLPRWTLDECQRVPFGHCLCGRTAASGALEFAADLDARHEHCHQSLPPHGHYCVPIVSRRGVLGVINLYLQAGHARDPAEESFLGAIADALAGILERHRAEAELRQAQKLEAVGQLAAGVAHDFNNLLSAIQMQAELLCDGLGERAPLRPHATRIASTVRRAAALTRQLLTFARKEAPRPEVLALDTVVDGMRGLLGDLLGTGIELTIELGAPGALVRADRGQLEQVLANLAVNARDAMPGGGRLRIATAAERADGGGAPGPAATATTGQALLTVTDTGEGIPAELLPRLFEPFFTTKGAHRGTGLGLAIVDRIAREAGGAVGVTSTPGQGTTFTVCLPQFE